MRVLVRSLALALAMLASRGARLPPMSASSRTDPPPATSTPGTRRLDLADPTGLFEETEDFGPPTSPRPVDYAVELALDIGVRIRSRSAATSR